MTSGLRLVDVSAFPNATRARFLMLALLVGMLSFTTGQRYKQFIPTSGDVILNAGWDSGAYATAAVFGFALLFYLFHPLIRARSFGDCNVLLEGDPIAQRITDLSEVIGVRVPRLLMDKNILNYDAIAFGWPWRKTILLGRGLLLLKLKRPSDFDVRMAHELGHIKNRDIPITFVAQGLVLGSVIILVLVCSLFVLTSLSLIWTNARSWAVAGGDLQGFIDTWGAWTRYGALSAVLQAAQAGAWAMLLLIDHRAFLRTRELYADSVAAKYFGSEATVAALVPRAESSLPPRRLWSMLTHLFSAHPEPINRQRVAAAPLDLLKPDALSVFGYGYAIGLLGFLLLLVQGIPEAPKGTAESVDDILRLTVSLSYLPLLFIFMPLGAISFIGLLSLIMRLSSWTTLTDRVFSERALSVALMALLLAVGILTGVSVNPLKFIFLHNGARIFLPGLVDLSAACLIGACLFIGTIAFGPIVRRLVTAPKVSPPGTITWVCLWFLANLFISYFCLSFFALFDPKVHARGNSVALFAVELVIALFVWTVSYAIARRTISPKIIPSNQLARWVMR